MDDWHPMGDGVVRRNELAAYLNRLGRGVNCRLDVPILTLNDMKAAATVFSELAKELAHLAFEDDRVEIYRVLSGRHAMETAREKLSRLNRQKLSISLAKDAERKGKR